jgi:hypothetical protein
MRSIVAAVMLLGMLLLPAERAFACKGVPVTDVDTLSQEAVIIASGTLVNSTEDVITLQVEEYFKGDVRASEITLNNHRFANDPSCRPIIGEGGWLPEGVRVLAFLQGDEFGLAELRPAGLFRQSIFKIPDDPAHQMVFADGEEPLVTLDEARTVLAALYGPAAAPDGSAGGGSSGSGGVDGNVGTGVVVDGPAVKPGREPLIVPGGPVEAPVIDPMPPVKVFPPPAVQPAAEPAPLTSGAPVLPRILLGVLIAISLLLALWAALTTLRQRRAGEEV